MKKKKKNKKKKREDKNVGHAGELDEKENCEILEALFNIT